MLTTLVKKILFLTRPEVAPNPKKRNLPFKTTVYLFVLKRMAARYGRYAWEDTIRIGNALTIRHLFKDSEFEKELQRMNIVLKPHMSPADVLKTRRTNKSESFGKGLFYNYFHFSDTITVSGFNREISIDRESDAYIYGTFTADARISSPGNQISAVSVNVTLPKKEKNSQPVKTAGMTPKTMSLPAETSATKKTRTQKTRALFGKETNPVPAPKTTQLPSQEPPVPQTTVVRGIEIDNDF